MDPVTATILGLVVITAVTSCLGACTSILTWNKSRSQDASSNENTSNVNVENTLIEDRNADGGHHFEKKQKFTIENYNTVQQLSITKTIKTGGDNEVANQLAATGNLATGFIPGVNNPFGGITGAVEPGITAAKNLYEERKEKKKEKKKLKNDKDSLEKVVLESEEFTEKKSYHKKHKPGNDDNSEKESVEIELVEEKEKKTHNIKHKHRPKTKEDSEEMEIASDYHREKKPHRKKEETKKDVDPKKLVFVKSLSEEEGSEQTPLTPLDKDDDTSLIKVTTIGDTTPEDTNEN